MSVSFETSHGKFEVHLYCEDAPKACRNFVELAKDGYYDGCIFHRLIKGFMAQTGDPDPVGNNGAGGKSIYGGPFEDEIVGKFSHDRMGIISMANAGLNTNASQWFVTFGPCEHLDGKHTLFGYVPEEFHPVLRDMENVKTSKKNRPVKDMKIFCATVIEDPWAGQPLPKGARLPEKPLVQHKDKTDCGIQ
jgi:cyclophilin family peptidyl-prolyl cis-trans isomerase